jgi:hypothetical protein
MIEHFAAQIAKAGTSAFLVYYMLEERASDIFLLMSDAHPKIVQKLSKKNRPVHCELQRVALTRNPDDALLKQITFFSDPEKYEFVEMIGNIPKFRRHERLQQSSQLL